MEPSAAATLGSYDTVCVGGGGEEREREIGKDCLLHKFYPLIGCLSNNKL